MEIIQNLKDYVMKLGKLCINDGIRPVIFKIESTNEQSKINYEPIK